MASVIFGAMILSKLYHMTKQPRMAWGLMAVALLSAFYELWMQVYG